MNLVQKIPFSLSFRVNLSWLRFLVTAFPPQNKQSKGTWPAAKTVAAEFLFTSTTCAVPMVIQPAQQHSAIGTLNYTKRLFNQIAKFETVFRLTILTLSSFTYIYNSPFQKSLFLIHLKCCIFLFDDSPASEFYMQTFRNTLFHLNRRCNQEE